LLDPPASTQRHTAQAAMRAGQIGLVGALNTLEN
jgi:hypothetical protein